jgi:hypothetical protein
VFVPSSDFLVVKNNLEHSVTVVSKFRKNKHYLIKQNSRYYSKVDLLHKYRGKLGISRGNILPFKLPFAQQLSTKKTHHRKRLIHEATLDDVG